MIQPKRFRIPCIIRITHTWESLEAHVELPGRAQPEIGDRITVHGAPVQVPFGETITIEREATVRRAGPLEKLWVKIRSMFELDELYEVNFTTEILR
ncbi:MAG: hypothetical protein AAGA72_03885 [Pseudomonadota bacterium]